jgi:hypothetical protein
MPLYRLHPDLGSGRDAHAGDSADGTTTKLVILVYPQSRIVRFTALCNLTVFLCRWRIGRGWPNGVTSS